MSDNPVEDLLLSAYPNPGRVGCPGSQMLENLAEQPARLDDSATQHVWRCSPCFREFRSLRDRKRAALRRRRQRQWGAALAACAGVILMMFVPRSPSRIAPKQETGILDFSNESEERGGETAEKSTPPFPLPARKMALILGRNSATGTYKLEVRSGAHIGQAIRGCEASAAKQSNGTVRMECDLGAPLAAAGSYVAAWREQSDPLWHYGLFTAH